MGAPLNAVVFSAGVIDSAPALAGWLDAGHRITAVVFPASAELRVKRSLRHDRFGSIWSLAGILKRGAPEAEVHFHPRKADSTEIEAMLKRLKPDLIISSIWMHKIPEHYLALARLGGINLHPALLPLYRGPDPICGMILAGDIAKAGGVTLHQMNGIFDDGPIIAQIPVPEVHWQEPLSMRRALGSAQYQLARDDLPKWINGAISARPQSAGHWHSYRDTPSDIDSSWPADRLLLISKLLLSSNRRRRMLSTPSGRYKLPQILRRLGPPTGAPPEANKNRLRFDCADARIEATAQNRLAYQIARYRTKVGLRRSDLLIGLRSIPATTG